MTRLPARFGLAFSSVQSGSPRRCGAAGASPRAAVSRILEIEGLRTEFRLKSANVVAVDDVSFHVDGGECVGVVGESGCGKTTIGLSIMKLLPPVGHVIGGTSSSWARTWPPCREGDDQGPGQRGGHGVPGPADLAQPDHEHRGPNCRERPAPPGRLEERGPEPGARRPAHGRDAERRTAARRLPPRALRRPAPAGHDRHGAGLLAQAPHRGRADDGARRHHSGPDPRPARPPPEPISTCR